MNDFTEGWLSMRAVADERARSTDIARQFLQNIVPGDGEPAVIVDLGGGSGNNAAFLSGLADDAVQWRIVDSDPDLLSAARRRIAGADCRLADLSEAAEIQACVADASAVTCSALLDLVSREWLALLCDAAAADGVPVLAALTYSGGMTFSPAQALDDKVVQSFNRHQTGNKGFGPALGPAAGDAFGELLSDFEYETRIASSDWALDPSDTSMIKMILEGIYSAVSEIEDGADAAPIETWYRDRLAQLEKTKLTVSHVDILGLPPRGLER